jgi:hypothetical protein
MRSPPTKTDRSLTHQILATSALCGALLLDTSGLFAQWSPRAGKLLAAMKETSHA